MQGFRLAVLGYIGVASIWVVILASLLANPGIAPSIKALSDLGGPKAASPQVFNVGLLLVALIFAFYSLGLVARSENSLWLAGSAAALLSSLCLFLVALFPEGTPYHWHVSVAFFVLAALAVVLWGLGAMRACCRAASLFPLSSATVSVAVTIGSAGLSMLVVELVWIVSICTWILSSSTCLAASKATIM